MEREVSDLQSEFQLDRTDYLESIRRLEQNLKFYHQLIEKALPILRKDGRYWDLEAIRSVSVWNDDLCKWKFPNDLMNKLKLPPAGEFASFKFVKIVKLFFSRMSFDCRVLLNLFRIIDNFVLYFKHVI